jgi:hypothetical protein
MARSRDEQILRDASYPIASAMPRNNG